VKNRAKCKLCGDIIESKTRHDMCWCKCGEIAVDGGQDYHKCIAGDWANFIRVDDEGNEIIPKIVEKTPEESAEKIVTSLTKQDHIDALTAILTQLDRLPEHAWSQPITHYDYYSLVALIRAALAG